MVLEVAIVVIPESAPAEETSKLVESMTSGAEPPPMVTVPEEVPVLILVAKLEPTFKLMAAPEAVNPKELVSNPAEVMVPEPVVEMFPEVVMAPVPALTPTATTAPALETLKFGALI